MGGSQSVRKITIDNNNADVIKVSQSVVERLKSGKMDLGKTSDDSVSEESKSSVRTTTVPIVTSNLNTFVPPYPYHFPGSIPIQEEIQREVEKTNDYWKQRISKLESTQSELTKKMQNEYNKTMKEFENVLPELGAKKAGSKGNSADLTEVKDKLIKCYKDNKSKSLNCASEVEHFNRCFEQKRVLVQQVRT